MKNLVKRQLTEFDIKRLKIETIVSFKISLLFVSLIFLISLIVFGIIFLFKLPDTPSPLANGRVYFVLIVIGLPFILFLKQAILIQADLLKRQKLVYQFIDYKIITKNDKQYIEVNDVQKQKIKISKNLSDKLCLDKKLSIEITFFSKTLLFLSNDNHNLLDDR